MCEVCVQLESVRCINRVTMSDGAYISVTMSDACVSSLLPRLGRTGWDWVGLGGTG